METKKLIEDLQSRKPSQYNRYRLYFTIRQLRLLISSNLRLNSVLNVLKDQYEMEDYEPSSEYDQAEKFISKYLKG